MQRSFAITESKFLKLTLTHVCVMIDLKYKVRNIKVNIFIPTSTFEQVWFFVNRTNCSVEVNLNSKYANKLKILHKYE